ncbi:MAG TPA: hypothetical protein VMA72_28510 [Streptosporangiaceae bacterium]|nr:hypothetical protein [Streptosporangiaceae bacterium]
MSSPQKRWSVPVSARSRWVRTGVVMQAGALYSLTAAGCWCDAGNRCGPGGYDSTKILRLFEWTRRVRHAKWFALIGALDSARDDRFVIGQEHSYQPTRSGELLCFANDAWIAYFNNHGTVTLTIEVTPAR